MSDEGIWMRRQNAERSRMRWRRVASALDALFRWLCRLLYLAIVLAVAGGLLAGAVWIARTVWGR